MSTRQKIKVSDIKDLICLVKERPAIYNANLKEHNDKKYIEDCWKTIGERLKCKASECRIKWTVLRNSYSRSLRRIALKCPKKPWYLADSMSFLKDHMRQTEKDGAFNEKFSPFSDYENQSMQSNESNETSSEMSRRTLLDESSEKLELKYSSNHGEFCYENDPLKSQEENMIETKPCINIVPFATTVNQLDQQVYTKTEHTNLNRDASHVDHRTNPHGSGHEFQSESLAASDEDADMLFLRSMHKDLRKLSSSRKRRFKIEMMTALYNYLEEDERNKS